MEMFQIYPAPPLAAVEQAQPLVINRACRRCPNWQRARTVCLGAEGVAGGLLSVGERPGQEEDAIGRPHIGRPGKILRGLIAKYWQGPVALDNATRCFTGSDEAGEAAIDACRGYLRRTIDEVRPTRILALGAAAAQSILGRRVSPLDVRRGFGWLANGGAPIPVFLLMHPAAAARNRFLLRWLEEDMRWALQADPPFKPAWGGIGRVVVTEADAREAGAALTAAPWFAYDAETAGYAHRKFQMLVLACTAAGSDDSWLFEPRRMGTAARRMLVALLRDKGVFKKGQNIKVDEAAVLHELGALPRGTIADIRLQRKLLDANAAADLDTMANLVGMGGHKEEKEKHLAAAKVRVAQQARDNARGQLQLAGLDSGDEIRPEVQADIRADDQAAAFAYGYLPAEVRRRYVARDAVATARLGLLMEQRLAEDDPALARIYEAVVHPASQAIRQVQEWGIRVDVGAMTRLHEYFQGKLSELHARFKPYGINPGSDEQVADLLFARLKLPTQHKSKSGTQWSVDEDALKALKGRHPIISDIESFRWFQKMDGTYAKGMLAHVRDDGRIHGNILLDGARSGRTSMTDPSLQVLPRAKSTDGSTEGKLIRDCFVASPGCVLLEFDYKQVEICIAAGLSEDEEMLRIIRAGEDFHRRTAEMICKMVWGVEPAALTEAHRDGTKAFNFGIIYGKSDAGIAFDTGCSVAEAAKIRHAVLGRFARLNAWIAERLAETRRTGYAHTWWDGGYARRRPLYQVADQGDEKKRSRETAERSSWNNPIQGTASEFCIDALAEVVNWILGDAVPAKLELPVHDSLLFEVEESAVDEVLYQVPRLMTRRRTPGGVPLRVDIKGGKSWGSMEPIKLAA